MKMGEARFSSFPYGRGLVFLSLPMEGGSSSPSPIKEAHLSALPMKEDSSFPLPREEDSSFPLPRGRRFVFPLPPGKRIRLSPSPHRRELVFPPLPVEGGSFFSLSLWERVRVRVSGRRGLHSPRVTSA